MTAQVARAAFPQGKDLPQGRLRLASPYDPDARYGIKRQTGWTGYKVHLTETCDTDSPHVITHVATTDATVGDSDLTATIHDELAEPRLLPTEHAVDSGYTGATLVVRARDQHHIELLGPLSTSTSPQSSSGNGFDQSDFLIDWDNQQVTCPQGKISSAWNIETSRGLPLNRVTFRQRDCGPCPARPHCTTAKAKPRKLTLRPRDQHEVLQHARRQQRTDEWKQRYNIRAGVESTISQTPPRHRRPPHPIHRPGQDSPGQPPCRLRDQPHPHRRLAKQHPTEHHP
jgi:hypothetical protein